MSKPRLLALVDNPLGRDTEILLPVTYVLEKYFNTEVKYKFIWDLLFIEIWHPDVLLLPNIRGHHMYVEAAEFAYKNNIKVLALESEGNFQPFENFDFWGYNLKKRLYSEWITCWSERISKYYKSFLPEAVHERVIVTGATGFDRYIFGEPPNTESILSQHNKSSYKKVIGYAGWAFGKLHSNQKEVPFQNFFPENRQWALSWLEYQRVAVREALRYAVINNPDTLFILKKHPKEDFEDNQFEGLNEMNELVGYHNVLYVKNEIPIESLISISGIWLGFETTTLMEAWLLNKPTILINEDVNFPRPDQYKGAIIVRHGLELDMYIKKIFNTEIALYEDEIPKTETFKNELLCQSIGYTDGLNHLRAAYYFSQNIPRSHTPKNIIWSPRHIRLFLLMNIGRFFYSKKLFRRVKKLAKTIYVFENRGLPGLAGRMYQVYKELDNYYSLSKIDSALEDRNWKHIFGKSQKHS